MTGPRLGQGMPVDDSWITRQLSDLQRQITELRAAMTLDASTISPNGTLTVDGTLDVTGDLKVSGTATLDGALTLDGTLTAGGTVQSNDYVAGTSGWKLDGSTDNAEFNSLTLRSGIIGNDSLANPIAADSAYGSVTGQTFAASPTIAHSETVTVPAGFSQAFIVATGSAVGVVSGVSGLISTEVVIHGVTSDPIPVSSDGLAMSTATFAQTVTGLSAGAVTCSVKVSQTGLAASSGAAYLTVLAVFLR